MPIGGHYTMDRFDAVTAVELIDPARSSPATTTRSRRSRPTPQAFKADVQNAGFSQVYVLEPGETHTVK